jgi:DNA mismatch endonuclease (patch repair protein)
MDHLPKARRSWNMSRIRSKDTKPEIVFRKLLHKAGYRYRLYDKNLPGKPDLVLKKYKTVVFIHGCFWHHHENCSRAVMPKSNTVYWDAKLTGNRARDADHVRRLEQDDWRVFIVWECELKQPEKALERFKAFLSPESTEKSSSGSAVL